MNIVISILISILAFGFLIFTHELGHFLTARAFGVTVKEFCIGFGPKMLWYTSKKTGIKYALAMLPFGGYVSMEGEDSESEDPNALHKKAAWKRLIIMAAGGVVNLITGFLLILILTFNLPMGTTVVKGYPKPDPNAEPQPSTSSIFQPGDEILSVAGQRVHIADELEYQVMRYGYEPVAVEVLRNGEVLTFTVQFPTVKSAGQVMGTVDFVPEFVTVKEGGVGMVLKHTFYRCYNTVEMVWESIFDLIRGRYSIEAMSGPIGITEMIGTTVGQEGYSFAQRALSLLWLVAMIAVNLGVMNLMPLPALDGGRILFLLIEVIFRRPVPQKVEGMVHGIGIALLFLLMIVIAVKDVIGIFT